jgi:hypothetical protein
MVAEARIRAGGSPGYRLRFPSDLEQLATALRTEANLTPTGLEHARHALLGQLVTQVQADCLIAEHPEINSLPLRPPVLITGLHRTGTTLLQNILAEHPAVRAPRLWELLAPADLRPRRQLVRSARRYVEEYYAAAPRLRTIHPLDAHRPEECHRLTGVTFRSSIYALRYHVPSYVSWLERQDMRPAYEYHRTLLRCLLWRRPGYRVLLKCPTHLWHLDALAAVYPDARVVWLHRAPRDSLGSLCSLTAVVRAARAVHVDKHEIGRYWLQRAEHALSPGRRLPAGMEILHVRYEDLVADPEVTALRVCDFAHIPLSAHARRRLRRFVRRNPQGGHGVHRYSLSDYGLDPDQLDQSFAAYRAKFGL